MARLIETLETTHSIISTKPPLLRNIDRYFRRINNPPSRLAQLACSQHGEGYLNSHQKRVLDLVISVPGAVVATPIILALGLLKKLEDGGPIFFRQERVGRTPTERINVIKIRCMQPNSDFGEKNIQIAKGLEPHEDPRNTNLGSFLRKYQLEELPQLFQVMSGKLSLIGVRLNAQYGFDYLQKKWSQEKFESWRRTYFSGKPGLSGVNQAMGTKIKEDEQRYHPDVFYTKNASLGLDLYIIWRTAVRILLERDSNQS